MKTIREAFLWLGMFFLAIITGATIYQMIVIVPEFSRDLPNGMIEFAKGHIQTRNFWLSPIMPVGFLILFGALITNWKTMRRKWLISSIAVVIAGELLTLIVVVPQLKIMGLYDGNPSADLNQLAVTIKEWILIDRLRFFVLGVPAFFLFLKALTVNVERNKI